LVTASNIEGVVRRAEILRRAGKSDLGLRLLDALAPEGPDVPLVSFARATWHWTQGEGNTAARLYEEAVGEYERLGDHDGVLAARIGVAREARRTYRMEKRALLDAALAAADQSVDVHMHAGQR
jgi:hypothetical protein